MQSGRQRQGWDDEQERVRMREGERDRPALSHTRPVPTVDPDNPCLNWGRIPAHMFPCSERTEEKGEEEGCDTSDRPLRLASCAMCKCTLLEYKHTPQLSAPVIHKCIHNCFTIFFFTLPIKRRNAFSYHLTLLSHILLCATLVSLLLR